MRARLPKFVLDRPIWQIDAAGVAIVCAAAGIWYFAGIEPLGRVQAEWESLDAELVQLREVAHTKAALAARQERDLKKKREILRGSELQLRRASAVNGRVSELTAAATEARLTVDEIKPSPSSAMPRFTVVPIRLTGRGDYRAVLAFLGELRNEFGDVGVTGFSLSRPPEASEMSESLGFELNLVWYAAPELAPQRK